MNWKSVSKVRNERSLAERLTQIVDATLSLEALGWAVSLLAGLGLLGFVGGSWLLFFVERSAYAAVSLLAIGLCVVSVLALVRSPVGLIAVWGGAAVCTAVFFSGHGRVLMP